MAYLISNMQCTANVRFAKVDTDTIKVTVLKGNLVTGLVEPGISFEIETATLLDGITGEMSS